MDTDIRKPKGTYSFGIQRVRDSTTASTSTDSDRGGGGGNEMDEEERIGDDTPDAPLDDDDERNFTFRDDQIESMQNGRGRPEHDDDEDEFEDSDSDDEQHRPRTVKDILFRAWKWTKQFVLPNPSAATVQLENPQAAIRGPTFARQFKAPPGKRISHVREGLIDIRNCYPCAY